MSVPRSQKNKNIVGPERSKGTLVESVGRDLRARRHKNGSPRGRTLQLKKIKEEIK